MTPEQRAAAWRAIAANLTGREHGSDRMAATVAIRTGCTRQDAYEVIQEAIRDGRLTFERVRRGKGSGTYRRLRLTQSPDPPQAAQIESGRSGTQHHPPPA